MSDFEGGRPCRLKNSRLKKARDSNSPTYFKFYLV